MSKVIGLNDYKKLKRRDFFINFYHFLNRNLNGRFEDLLQSSNEKIINLLLDNNFDPGYISYFQVPIVTFMVTVFIRNSDLSLHFPEITQLDNHKNKKLFNDTMKNIIHTIIRDFEEADIKADFDKELNHVIEQIFNSILDYVPNKIILV